MANWAIGFNSALKSGWDTWNKLGGVRQAAARAQAADQVAANNKALENDNASLNGIANDMRADQVNQALTDTFGDASEATKAGAREYGILRGDGSLDYGKLQEYGQKFGAQPQQAIPAQGAGAPPVVTDPQAEPVPQGQAIPTGGAPQADPGVASVRDQMMSQGQRAFDENAKAQRAINEDIAQAKYDRAVETGKKNREAMHEYNKWYNPDALEKEDEYQLNQTFKAMGKLVDANDPGAMEFMARAYSAMGNGNIRSNGDGTFTMVDKSGAPMGEAFKPSMQQFGTLMTNLYNTARLMKTWDPEAYLKTRKAMAETEGAELKNVGQGYKNEQEKVNANVANKYGMRKADADTRNAESNATKGEADANVAQNTVQYRINKSKYDADSAKHGAQIKGEEAKYAGTYYKGRADNESQKALNAKQQYRINEAKANRDAEKFRLQKEGMWNPSGKATKPGDEVTVAGKPAYVETNANPDGTYTVRERKNGRPTGTFDPRTNSFYPNGTSYEGDKQNYEKEHKSTKDMFAKGGYSYEGVVRNENGILVRLVRNNQTGKVLPYTGDDEWQQAVDALTKGNDDAAKKQAIQTGAESSQRRLDVARRLAANAKNIQGNEADPGVAIDPTNGDKAVQYLKESKGRYQKERNEVAKRNAGRAIEDN